MPVQDLARDQQWLLPPSLSDLIPPDHAVRFVAEFVDAISPDQWRAMGINPAGVRLGRASYSVRALLGIWVYGFLVGVRSTRKREAACREQIPVLWLAGMATPDHNTLWGFYAEHRTGMRHLLRRTIKVAVGARLIDLAVQAVDGTKIWGNASRERFRSRTGLTELLAKTDEAIADLEAQNATSGATLPALPKELTKQRKLREKITAALAVVPPEPDRDPPPPGTKKGKGKGAATGKLDRGPRASLTDPDVRLMKDRHHRFGLAYNGLAVVSPLVVDPVGRQGTLVTVTAVSQNAGDVDELTKLLDVAQDQTGVRARTTADGGFYSTANLVACAEREQTVLMPVPKSVAPDAAYAKERFVFDPATDTYRCPEGHTLRRVPGQITREAGRLPAIRYRALRSVCQACPVLALCQSGVPGKQAHGRSITFTAEEDRVRAHRRLMEQEENRALYAKRKEWVEPKFGTLKTEQDGRRFLLRGLDNVTDEWSLLNTAGNLRTLWRRWVTLPPAERWSLRVAEAA